MTRFLGPGAAVAGLFVLIGVCFGPAIGGRQFSYRDAAHYYYPLYKRVQTEWNAGRVPLWEPEENAGMPLLGNPTAAVLYPGKLIYTLLPYPLAARVYVIAHTLLAFAGTFLLGRSLGISATGSMIAALSYAFGAPILFQYCNVIYLVGAAWVPWGVRALDGWLRRGSRWAIAGLAVVLAMQVLGGDPQAAYLEGLCGGAYALVLARRDAEPRRLGAWTKMAFVMAVVVVLATWIAVTLALGYHLPLIRPKKVPPPTFGWNKYLPMIVAGVWGLAGLVFVQQWIKRRRGVAALGRRLAGLAVAAVLAGAMAGAQLLPVLEFTSLTGRSADEGTHDVYPFSFEPYRVIESVWPNVFGTLDHGNHSWLFLIPPVTSHRMWVPSLYLGGATIVFALAGLFARGGPVWRGWLAGVVVISLVAAVGEFAGPLWVGRCFKAMVPYLGPHDPPMTNAIRQDGFLRDGDGSVYSILATAIPGFQQFRYPSKLLTFTVLGLVGLAGHGWDRLVAGNRRPTVALAGLFLALSLIGTACVSLAHVDLLALLGRGKGGTSFGPFEPAGAWLDTRNALVQGAAVFGATLAAALFAARRPWLVGPLMVLVVAVDLAYANGRLVNTSDQAEFDRVPKALALIAEAEKANPSPGPYRIHRMPIWSPSAWTTTAPTDRVTDFLRWERDSIQPKYGLPYGVHYTSTQGVAELYDYEWFFAPFRTKMTPELAERMRLDPNDRLVYYPRRGYDLWNTRYFVLPGYPIWTDAERGVASLLLTETERVYPAAGAFDGPDGEAARESWARTEDMQIVRNKSAFPRAWVVHDVKFSTPIEGLSRERRALPMEEMLYAADPFWNDPERIAHDPKSLAWFEVSDPSALARFRARGNTGPGETVTVWELDPRQVELSVTLDRPGFVILADVFYPGWTLTIDGQPAPILRANRLMRGAAVEAGKHVLIYKYRPRSFTLGMVASLSGLLGLLATAAWAAWRPRRSGSTRSRPD